MWRVGLFRHQYGVKQYKRAVMELLIKIQEVNDVMNSPKKVEYQMLTIGMVAWHHQGFAQVNNAIKQLDVQSMMYIGK